MTQIATVERILNARYAEISVARQSACAHDCGKCAGCGTSAAPVYARAENPVGAEPGQKVVVRSSTCALLGIAALVYLTPAAGFLLFYLSAALTGATVPVQYAAAALGFLLGIVPAVRYDRRLRKSGGMAFTIERLF